MAESSLAWLSVIVKWGSRTVVPRKIIKIGWDSNFGELLVANVTPKFAFLPKILFWTLFINWMSQLHSQSVTLSTVSLFLLGM